MIRQMTVKILILITMLSPIILSAAEKTSADGGLSITEVFGSIAGIGAVLGVALKLLKVLFEKLNKAKKMDGVMAAIYDHLEGSTALMDYLGAKGKKDREASFKEAKKELEDIIEYWKSGGENKDSK